MSGDEVMGESRLVDNAATRGLITWINNYDTYTGNIIRITVD